MLSAVILSGGLGSRMGMEKGLAPLNSKPMIHHVLETVREETDEVFVAVRKGATSRYVGIVADMAEVIEDRELGRGPLEGLLVGFRRAKGEYVLVTPCDTPFVNGAVLRLLAHKAIGRDGALPIVRGFKEPLLAVYSRSAACIAFENELERGKGKVSDAICRLDINLVPEEEMRALDGTMRSFWNINSREDLAQAERIMKLNDTTSSSPTISSSR